MKLASKFATLAFGLTAFSAVQAAPMENLYGGVSFSSVDLDGVSPKAIGAHVGAKLSENLAAEARFGIGMGDDKGFEVDNYYSVLAKGILPIQDNLSVYGLVGFSRVAVSYSETWCDPFFGCFKAEGEGSDSGLSLGAGAEFALTPKISVSAEYLMMVDDADALSVAASYKF
jgi:opacity protein-like surface antigen